MKRDNVTNYLGDIKATYDLIDRIKQYYYHRGISLVGVKFEPVAQLDQWGSKMYSIRSNIVFDINSMSMRIE